MTLCLTCGFAYTSNMKNWWLVNISSSWLHLLITCMRISLSGDTPLIFSRSVIRNVVQMYYIWATCSQTCGLGYKNLQRLHFKTSALDYLVIWYVAAIGNLFWNAGFKGHCCLCTFHCSPIPVIHSPHTSTVKDTQAQPGQICLRQTQILLKPEHVGNE